MPRKSRIDAPTAIHHVIIRGIEQRDIFLDDQDYTYFLDRLEPILAETSTVCYAWALLPNHVHLLLRTGAVPLSTVMRRLLTGYAVYFNRRCGRSGHLFQNRYKSILCEEEPYFLELVRYIHLNPLRAGLVSTMDALEAYPWCGHGAVVGRVNPLWQDTQHVLSFFADTERPARRAYQSFVENGINMGRRVDLTGGGLIRSMGGWSAVKELRGTDVPVRCDERILGSSDFVSSVLRHANEAYKKRTLAAAQGLDLDDIITLVSEHFSVDQTIIKSAIKQKAAARARGIVCHLAASHLRMTGTELAEYLGLTPSGICKLAARGRTDPETGELSERLEDIVAKRGRGNVG